MSEESATSPESSATPSAEPAPRARRISNPRPKKKAKAVKADAAEETTPAKPAAETASKASKFPVFPTSEKAPEATEKLATRADWPEPEAASSGAESSQEAPKRKRRRKKGKGGGNQNTALISADGESVPQATEEVPEATLSPQPQRQNQAPRPKLDAEALAKYAWKIYLAEVSEEGVALIGENDAKELSRRCFRLAEIFMEERARRR